MPKANVKQITQKNKFLTGNNANNINNWQDIANFCLPRKAWMNSMRLNAQPMAFNFLYDSTAILCAQKAVSGFHSNLTNQATEWFGLTLYDRSKMSKGLETWFKKAVKTMLAVMSQTNLYNVLKEFYLDYVVFGTGSILTQKHPKSKVSYMSIPLQQLNIVEDDEEKVIETYNNFRLSALQAYGKWGEKCGKSILDAYHNDKPFEMFEFIHYVGPRGNRDPNKIDNMNMRYESVWISKKDNHIIEESGFNRYPYQTGRFWKDNTDVFGFSPAMNVLADIKLMNACVRTWLRRAMKEADPPLSVPSRGHVLPLNLNPAAMNYRDPSLTQETLHAIGVATGNFSITEKFLEYIRHNIEQAFFVDVFQSFSMLQKNMTVPEVQKRIQEGMVLLGPIVSQCQYEVLTPLVLNTFFILLEDGTLGDVPEELYDNEFGPVYESPLSKAARESELQSMDGFLMRTGQMSQVFPEAKLVVNPVKTVNWIAQQMAIDPSILNSDQEVKQIMSKMQQMQQAQMGLQQAEQGAKVVKDGATAEHKLAQAKEVGA